MMLQIDCLFIANVLGQCVNALGQHTGPTRPIAATGYHEVGVQAGIAAR